MPRDGRIIDIRYFDEQPRAKLLEMFKWSTWVGDRIARKAREYGLALGRKDHVYLFLGPPPRPAMPNGITHFAHEVPCILDEAEVAALDQDGRDRLLAARTLDSLAAICNVDQVHILDRVRADLARAGRDLEVEFTRKESSKYLVVISNKLRPLRQGPLAPIRPRYSHVAILAYTDKVTGAHGAKEVFEFDDYNELFHRTGAITVKEGKVRLKTRAKAARTLGVVEIDEWAIDWLLSSGPGAPEVAHD
jgi:hypothetical protein